MQCAWIRLSCFFARGGEGLNLCFFLQVEMPNTRYWRPFFVCADFFCATLGCIFSRCLRKSRGLDVAILLATKYRVGCLSGVFTKKNEAFLIDLYLGVTSHLYPSDVSWTSLRRLWDVHVTSRWNSCEIPAQPLRPPCDRRATAERPPRYAGDRRDFCDVFRANCSRKAFSPITVYI